ncbi:DUF6011 domain-containing protein [Streptomyces sp. NPDC005969]|uniref:DUF6011 domain-containing protein n=1 Tax=Streptomyces sp. NPDC005969 TaxID=3156722 RepID=UPI0034064EA1
MRGLWREGWRTLTPDSTAPPPRCGSCGRLLRSQASRARGLGPYCARALRGRTGPAVAVPDVEPVPGQLEIPLPPMQHELTWSL